MEWMHHGPEDTMDHVVRGRKFFVNKVMHDGWVTLFLAAFLRPKDLVDHPQRFPVFIL